MDEKLVGLVEPLHPPLHLRRRRIRVLVVVVVVTSIVLFELLDVGGDAPHEESLGFVTRAQTDQIELASQRLVAPKELVDGVVACGVEFAHA